MTMKKITLHFTKILILITVMCFSFTSCQNVKYQSGRDTIDIFGDGTYQILQAPIPPDESGNSKPTYVYALYNNDTESVIEDNVIEYLQIKQNIYTFGDRGYTVLNYETGKITQEKLLKDIPDKYQEIFSNENNFTKLRK